MVARRITVERMKIRRWSAGLLLLAVGMVGCVSGAAMAAKPQSPLSLSWQLDSTPDADGAVRLTVTIHSPVILDGRVQLHAPGGVEVLEGPMQWAGPVGGGGSERVWRLRVQRPGKVTVQVRASSASNVHYSRSVTIRVPEGTEILHPKPAPEPEAPVHNGVREHPSG